VVRTRHVFFRSRPSTPLLVSTLLIIATTLALPYLPIGALFSFVPLPASLMLTLLGFTALYVLVTEAAKRYFYTRIEPAGAW
jgi:Mg2+-importing ATPase